MSSHFLFPFHRCAITYVVSLFPMDRYLACVPSFVVTNMAQ